MILTRKQVDAYEKCLGAYSQQNCDECSLGKGGGCEMSGIKLIATIRHYMDMAERWRKVADGLDKALLLTEFGSTGVDEADHEYHECPECFGDEAHDKKCPVGIAVAAYEAAKEGEK